MEHDGAGRRRTHMEGKTVRMDLMSAKQVAAYQKANDMVVLPVGCTEMHGPLIPVGCDAFEDWAVATVLAETWKCLVLPPIFYVYTGASEKWPGTVSISPEASIDYVKAVVKATLEAGFRRVVICASHGPLGFMAQTVIRSIYRETGDVVVLLSPHRIVSKHIAEEFGKSGEDLLVLGALKILGWHGAYSPESAVDAPMEFPFKTIGDIRRAGGTVPWLFQKDFQHTGLRTGIRLGDADRVVECIRKAAEEMRDLPEHFARYQREMKELTDDRPWEKDSIWSV
jgi:hypothetical protein